MSVAISSSVDCCTPCEENPSTSIPGIQGDDGDDGTNGTNGQNAYTTVTTQFLMPASLASVTIDVGSSAWAAVNQKIFIGVGASRGTFEVTAKPSATQLTLTNLETATEYLDNSPLNTVFAVGAIVSPSGLQGPAAAAGGGALLAANNLSDLVLAATARTNLGLGTAAVLTSGVANGNLAPVNDAGGLTNGESVWATAAGVESRTAVLARAGLGLVLGIADTQIPPINDAAGIVNGEALFATAAGIESKPAAAARAALGIAGGIAFRATRNGVNQGGVATGALTQVEFNSEVDGFDLGGYYDIGAWQFLPLVAGYYRITARVSFLASGGAGSTNFFVYLYKNAVLVAEDFFSNINHAVANTLEVSDIQQADGVGDEFQVFVRQSSGISMIINGSPITTYFCGEIVAI